MRIDGATSPADRVRRACETDATAGREQLEASASGWRVDICPKRDDTSGMSALLSPAPQKVDVHSPEAAKSVLSVFFRLADEWKLTPAHQQQLLAIPRATYYEWKKGRVPALDRDKVERLSYLLGIYKALQILFPTAERAARWIHAPNDAPLFGGRSALDRMLAGRMNDLHVVRQYLDAVRGGKA